MEYRYNCVSPLSLKELNFIIDNSREIKNATFKKKIGNENYKELENTLGYNRALRLHDDWAVSYFKSKKPNGVEVAYLRHSAIEYVYY